jgi:hypothetical protein
MFQLSRSRRKDNPIESDDEANRARIQAVIDRAIELPEVKTPEPYEVVQFSGLEIDNEDAA